MFSTKPSEHWKAWGDQDPYFGVYNAERFRTGHLDERTRREFFETGEREIDAALAQVRARLDPAFAPARALDFGCGVGRLTLPLARRCGEAVGVDISAGMLAEARRNAAEAGLANVRWVESDPALSRVEGTFDFIYSVIVFHHIRPADGYALLRRLLALLRPGGVLSVQVLFALHQGPLVRAARWVQARVPLANQAVNLLRRRPLGTPNMEANVYSLPHLFELLREAGCPGTYAEFQPSQECTHALLHAQRRRE
jgi:SAM-dependent methyltransferase